LGVWGGWVEEGLIDDANAALFYIAVKKKRATENVSNKRCSTL